MSNNGKVSNKFSVQITPSKIFSKLYHLKTYGINILYYPLVDNFKFGTAFKSSAEKSPSKD